MLVVCLGDVMLDVLVAVPDGLVPDDDTAASIAFAAGGQAANVAAWAVALGGTARVFGPRAETGPGRLVADALAARGVALTGPAVDRTGAVMSLVSAGSRSLASDAGDPRWLDAVTPGDWLAGAGVLLVSGYALLRAADPGRIRAVAAAGRAEGARVAVDLSSAAMIAGYGADRFRRLWLALGPQVVFANDSEWAATGGDPGDVAELVLKHGAAGATFVRDGREEHRAPVPGPVVDVTGAGDALAAGYLLGGPDLAMRAAARCVAQVGAQPPVGSAGGVPERAGAGAPAPAPGGAS